MTEIRRVHYKLNGTESPVIHLACRTVEQAREAERLASAQHQSCEEARISAFVILSEWMKTSKDYAETVQAWSSRYIQCGTCARGFYAWYEECEIGPEDDLHSWLREAEKIVTEKHWI